jgi:foldase protein PrsA
MSERIHATARKSSSGTKQTWTMVAGGSALMLLAAGVMYQVTRPTPAFPEDGKVSLSSKGQTSAEQSKKAGKNLARVGKEYINYDDLAAECVALHGKEILENLINRKILQQACDAQGIEISEAEVTKEIEKTAKKFGLGTDQYMQMLEAESNLTAMQYRRDRVWPLLALRKLAGEDVKVTEEDMKRAFIRHYGPRVKARAIIVDNPRRANEVWEKAREHPENFEKLAADYSIDPTSRAMGGRIPPIPRFSGSEELEKAAFKLKEGELSPVIQVGLNQHIILLCDGRTVPEVKERADVEEILMQELKEEKVQLAVAEVFKKIKSEARVDNYWTGESTGGNVRPAAGKAPAGAGAIKQTSATAGGNPALQAGGAQPGSGKATTGAKAGAGRGPGKAPARSADDQ